MLLNINNRLDSLPRTITNRVPLRPCRKRPSTLTGVPIPLLHERRILFNLTHIQPLQRLQQTFPILLLIPQLALHHCLRNEHDIPQLRPIRPPYEKTLFGDPHTIRADVHVTFVGFGLGSFDDVADDGVHHHVNGREILVPGVIVFVFDLVVDDIEGHATEGWEGAVFVGSEDDVGEFEEGRVWNVEVGRGYCVPD